MEPGALQVLTRRGQAQWLQAEVQRTALHEHARYLAALQALLQDPNFEVVLQAWFQHLFLTGDPGETTAEQRGEERFFWRIMRDLRQAGELPRQMAARERRDDVERS